MRRACEGLDIIDFAGSRSDNRVVKHVHRFLLLTAAACATSSAAAQKLYRWVDENGVVHYGDRIPPQYVDRDRDVLNDSGVTIGVEEGAQTDEERAGLARERESGAAERSAQAEH